MINFESRRIGIKRIFRQLVIHLGYTPILGIAALVGLARVGVYARILNVDDFGSLSKLFLISSSFGVVGSFGFQILAQRELPVMFARKHFKRGIVLLGRVALITSIFAIFISLLPFTNLQILDISPLLFLTAIAHGLGQQVYMLIVTDIRSRLEMMRYSLELLLRTSIATIVAVLVAYNGGGAVGVIVAEVLVNLLLTIKITKDSLESVKLSCTFFLKHSTKNFSKSEWKVSIILLIGTSLVFFSTSADRWMAAKNLSTSEFGLYSFAWISLSTALSIQALLNAGLFPLIANKRGAESNSSALRIAIMISGGLLVIGLVLAFFANFLASWILPIWFPQYKKALPLFLPLLLAAAFRVSDFWSSYLIIVHRQNALLVTQFGLLAFSFLLFLLLQRNLNYSLSSYSFAILALFLASGNYIANAVIACRDLSSEKK